MYIYICFVDFTYIDVRTLAQLLNSSLGMNEYCRDKRTIHKLGMPCQVRIYREGQEKPAMSVAANFLKNKLEVR